MTARETWPEQAARLQDAWNSLERAIAAGYLEPIMRQEYVDAPGHFYLSTFGREERVREALRELLLPGDVEEIRVRVRNRHPFFALRLALGGVDPEEPARHLGPFLWTDRRGRIRREG